VTHEAWRLIGFPQRSKLSRAIDARPPLTTQNGQERNLKQANAGNRTAHFSVPQSAPHNPAESFDKPSPRGRARRTAIATRRHELDHHRALCSGISGLSSSFHAFCLIFLTNFLGAQKGRKRRQKRRLCGRPGGRQFIAFAQKFIA
jgi:hypothetical protein